MAVSVEKRKRLAWGGTLYVINIYNNLLYMYLVFRVAAGTPLIGIVNMIVMVVRVSGCALAGCALKRLGGFVGFGGV